MRERMSAVDTAWLRMDSDKNLMMIVGVYEFDGKLDFARLSDLLRERLVSHLAVSQPCRSRCDRLLLAGGCRFRSERPSDSVAGCRAEARSRI